MSEGREKDILFIINPAAGRGMALKASEVIRKVCAEQGVSCNIRETSAPGDATSFALRGIEENFRVIAAVGGDGTVNEIGKVLRNSPAILGIVPAGSGNGLARHLRIPLDTGRAVRRLLTGKVISMDTGLLNENVFLNVAGIGFDARVSRAFAKTVRRGWYNYLGIILALSLKPSGLNVSMSVNGAPEVALASSKDGEVMMISFANSSQYGNNAIIAPGAHVTDGKLDICILKPIGFMRAMVFMYKLLTGRLRPSHYFGTFRATGLVLKGGDGLAHVDGEVIGVPQEFSVKILPHSLKVIC